MKKSLYAFTLVFLLSSIPVPVLRAERIGCNPHPQALMVQKSGRAHEVQLWGDRTRHR